MGGGVRATGFDTTSVSPVAPVAPAANSQNADLAAIYSTSALARSPNRAWHLMGLWVDFGSTLDRLWVGGTQGVCPKTENSREPYREKRSRAHNGCIRLQIASALCLASPKLLNSYIVRSARASNSYEKNRSSSHPTNVLIETSET